MSDFAIQQLKYQLAELETEIARAKVAWTAANEQAERLQRGIIILEDNITGVNNAITKLNADV